MPCHPERSGAAAQSKDPYLLRKCVVLFFFVCATIIAPAQSRIDCASMPSKLLHRDVPYCVLIPQSYDSAKTTKFPVLYFLHGLGDNQQSLVNMGAWNLISDLRAQNKIGDFLIATPAGWATFYINSADGKTRYSDFFLDEFIPFIEHKYRARTDRSGRAISGISMGGYGAFRFAFANPQKFSAVSAESAALFSDSPKILDQGMQSGAPRARLLGSVFGSPIDAAHWRANDPFELAKQNAAGISRLAIYFNCGQQDGYGFDEGAAALDKQLTAAKIPHTFRLYPGEHSLQYFLTHIGEVMEFHSREFAKHPAATGAASSK
ncbi:putative esterase [Candidatus Koribacter versatilis Ellin345]|uniref:Esterase n=1 Tax=Koribacter versatilis (strain Ellin345) TaxID=204669 RepID=Q1IMS4_KORVE|nr:alpha/beta hydrolase family protein [Candidatus Koribacter versatilis]ABF41826.1 putative esterase [Candidatus Koribacter versatilis Ellin345]